MIARNEQVKVLYATPEAEVPVAVILNGTRPPVTYRVTQLNSDELANLFENGDPDVETDILHKS